jgi:hypothetical protein
VIIVATAVIIVISSLQPKDNPPNAGSPDRDTYNNVASGSKLSPVSIGTKQQQIRLTSVATTNGDYFKKCAPIVVCNAGDKYRSYNGSCNNLQNPSWGAALTPFYRLADAEFSDGNILLSKKKKNKKSSTDNLVPRDRTWSPMMSPNKLLQTGNQTDYLINIDILKIRRHIR